MGKRRKEEFHCNQCGEKLPSGKFTLCNQCYS